MKPRPVRIPPLPEHAWSAEQRDLLLRGNPKRVLNIFATLIRHTDLYRAFMRFGGHILRANSLDARSRELVILRVGHLCESAYEFHQHTAIGKLAGLSDDEIAAVRVGPSAPGWSALERALLQATDELHQQSCIADATWAQLSDQLQEKQLMDLVFTVGQYTMVSMALNTLGVPIEA